MKQITYRLRYTPKKGRAFYGKRKFTSLVDAKKAERKAMKTGRYKNVMIT